ncbi:MAG: ABC transporter permease [Gammaproteobacteria bacterium]|nr:ABC transporter permease [Gammaproteobacteria bacterium]
MGPFVARRLLQMVPVLLGVSILTFALTNLLPGDPARAAAGRHANAEQLEAVRDRLGLDRPLPVQYAMYMGRLLQGDLGTSLTSKQAVAEELRLFFPATLELLLATMVIAVSVGIPLGVFTATRRGSWADRAFLGFSYFGVGMPVFFMALLLQIVFAGWLRVLPIAGRLGLETVPPPTFTGMYTVDALLVGQWTTLLDALRHLLLPALTLAMAGTSEVARITRRSMLQALDQEYVRTARAKGFPERTVWLRHALPNALLPTTTVIGLQVAFLLGGTVLIENLFSWGGLGTYAWTGIFRMDIPVIMGITLIATTVYLIVNLGVDLVYARLDPRIRYE